MKKICVFLSVWACVIAISSCNASLDKSSSDTDSVSYAIGVIWGFQVANEGLQFIDVSDAVSTLKEKVKEPVSAENNIYKTSDEFRTMLQKSPQRIFSEQEKNHITTLIGTLWAHQFRETHINQLNLSYTKQGIKDMLKNDTTALQLSIKQSSEYILTHRAKIEHRESQQRLEDGIAFLEKNKSKTGIIETESGLQYKIHNEGSDKKALSGDSVYLNITIRQINGDTIETSKSKGYIVDENRFVKGVYEGLAMFGEGAKFTLYIPSRLGFGEIIDPWITSKIKPNMTLIYDMEIEKLINN